MLRSLVSGFSLAILLSIAGCSGSGGEGSADQPPTYPVTGTVTLNGEPVTEASVSFRGEVDGKNIGAAGQTDSNGEFTLTTFQPGDGAVAGQHQVTVIKAVVEGEDPSYFDENSPNYGKEPPPTTTKYLVPEKYSKFETSGLTAEVSADGENEIKLELTE